MAFVEVPAKRAFGMVRDTDGSKLEGRLLSVSIARPRENEPTFTQEQNDQRTSRDSASRFEGRRFESGPSFERPNNQDSRDGQRPDRDNRFRPDGRFEDNRGDRPRPGFQGGQSSGGFGRPSFNGHPPRGDRPPYQPGTRDGRPVGRRDDRPGNGPQEQRPWARGGDRPGYQSGGNPGQRDRQGGGFRNDADPRMNDPRASDPRSNGSRNEDSSGRPFDRKPNNGSRSQPNSFSRGSAPSNPKPRKPFKKR